jgi:acetoin utilization deacetylase AcuC-like enzyme
MTLFYYDPVFMEHQTGDHPERPGRVQTVVRHLNFTAADSSCRRPSWESASIERILYVHTADYIDSLKQFAESGGGHLDADTVVSIKSFEVARRAAVRFVMPLCESSRARTKRAFCLIRPPGHHAMPDHAMGFCLLNNVAIAARVAINELGIDRVLIVDFDVHHGNGTQAMFWEDPNVGYFSMHRWPLYPGTGDSDEVGDGLGVGATMNLPIRFGTSRQQQLSQFDEAVHRFADHIKPQLILISAGFDSHKMTQSAHSVWRAKIFER